LFQSIQVGISYFTNKEVHRALSLTQLDKALSHSWKESICEDLMTFQC